ELDDLEEAIQVSRQAVQATPNNHPDLGGRLHRLSFDLRRRFERTEELDDLEEMIRVSRQAVQATPNDHPDLGGRLHRLSFDLRRRFERTEELDDLEEMIRVSRQAVQATPNDHPDLGGRLYNLGTDLEARYDRKGQTDDLEESIRMSRQAIAATQKNHSDIPKLFCDLGEKLNTRYRRKGKIEDIEEAIQLSRQAVQATPNDHIAFAVRLNKLGNNHSSRYALKGRIDDLEEAIRLSRQAIGATPDNHTNLPMFFSSLGTNLGHLYDRTGEMEYLEEAIEVSLEAVQAAPSDYRQFPKLLDILGSRLLSHYKRLGKLGDLEDAIRMSRQVIQMTPDDHPDFRGFLQTLATYLNSRYERTGNEEDNEEAIRVSHQVIQITPDDHPSFGIALNNLGAYLKGRYQRTENMDDLEEAIQLAQRVVHTTLDDDFYRAAWLNNLGTDLRSRYERTESMDDLSESIRMSRKAVEMSLDDHPNRAIFLYNLGIDLKCRYEQTEQIEDLKEAIRLSRQAVQTKSTPPLVRIAAADLGLPLLLKRKDYHAGYTLSVEAIDLLQLVHKRSLTLQDRQYVVSHFSGLATQACSLAIQSRQPLSEALRLLERGRGVILGLLMDDRSDTSELKVAHPDLCAQYESLRLEVNTRLESTESQRMSKQISTRRPKAVEELEKCIQYIRQLPGFEYFQNGLSVEKMLAASNEGSIIVVNVTNLRSDAIIISASGFSLVPLPRFEAVQAQRWVDQEVNSAGNNKSYRQFLIWLWRECVRPVLSELDNSVQSSLEELPRVWWIGTGLASSFPFHAACDISAGENTFCRVLSSYTPSIKALLHARERGSVSTPSNKTPRKLLVVTMANTPGANDLPGVIAERSTVLGVLGNSVQVECLDQPDSASVLRQIRECNVAHFACHGISDSGDPSQSGLLLQTATANPRQEILTVLKLCENHPTLGDIAYLSACSTAENQAEGLTDEALHVVSGFQVAGFRHVIGTLWRSDDSVCVEVARLFYAELCRNGALEYTDRVVAMALHKAVFDVSKKVEYRKRPLHWAQFVHYGA
ncbi:hypothetical protein PENSOL_c086G06413, partial [Penicillium solitum]